MIRNNSTMLPPGALGLRTSDYVDHLRTIAPAGDTHYVDGPPTSTGSTRSREATAADPGPRGGHVGVLRAPDATRVASPRPRPAEPARRPPGRGAAGWSAPPPGVEPGAFFDLLAARRARHPRAGSWRSTRPTTTPASCSRLEWRGWRLLFAGDAEVRSLAARCTSTDLLRPVHFVKVSHHGSHNGTYDELFDALLPQQSPDGRARHALVSTHDGDWDSVPDDDTLDVYSGRCTMHDTRTWRGAPRWRSRSPAEQDLALSRG